LYIKLEEVLGTEEASTLMEHLPPVGWADVATKQDLEHLRVATKQDLEHLRVATKKDIEHFQVTTKKDLEHFRVATKKDIDHLRVATKQQIETLEHSLTATFRGELISMQKNLVFAMIGSMVSVGALAFGAAQFL
jgi:hypothetical protein